MEESQTLGDEIDFTEGLTMDRGFLSPYFINDQERSLCEMKKPKVSLLDNEGRLGGGGGTCRISQRSKRTRDFSWKLTGALVFALLHLFCEQILVTDKKIDQVNDLIPLLEAMVKAKEPLCIVAEDVTGEALSALVVNKMRGVLDVVRARLAE